MSSTVCILHGPMVWAMWPAQGWYCTGCMKSLRIYATTSTNVFVRPTT